jgi:hypothetical protein
VSGRGKVNPFPPFFALGFFSFPKMDGGLRRHSTPSEMGGFSPSRRKASEDENSSSNALALTISVFGLPHPKLNQIDRRGDVSSS